MVFAKRGIIEKMLLHGSKIPPIDSPEKTVHVAIVGYYKQKHKE
jgi:hypothetical protein